MLSFAEYLEEKQNVIKPLSVSKPKDTVKKVKSNQNSFSIDRALKRREKIQKASERVDKASDSAKKAKERVDAAKQRLSKARSARGFF